MISWLKVWVNQIIIAAIIATIIEMILPEGNNKKYIKMILGIYILFCIINPLFEKFTGNSISILNIDYKQYIDNSQYDNEINNKKYEIDNSKLIEQAYIDNMKNDITSKIKEKGYNVLNINISIVGNTNSKDYGKISRLELNIEKLDNNQKIENRIEVNKIQIETEEMSNQDDTKTNMIKNVEKEKLKEFLKEEYSISKSIISIN